MARHHRSHRYDDSVTDSVEARLRTIDEAKQRHQRRGRTRHRSPGPYAEQNTFMAGATPHASVYNPTPAPQYRPKVATVYTLSDDSSSSTYYDEPDPRRVRAATPNGRLYEPYEPAHYEPNHHAYPINSGYPEDTRTANWIQNLPASELAAQEATRKAVYEREHQVRKRDRHHHRSHSDGNPRAFVPKDSPINKHSKIGDAFDFMKLLRLFFMTVKGGRVGKIAAVIELLMGNMNRSKDYRSRELRDDRNVYRGVKDAMMVRLQDPNTWQKVVIAWNNLKYGGKTAGFLTLAEHFISSSSSKKKDKERYREYDDYDDYDDRYRERGYKEKKKGGLLDDVLQVALDPKVLGKVGKFLDKNDIRMDDVALMLKGLGGSSKKY